MAGIGCGGVGTAAIAGAKLAGATTIIAVDIAASTLEKARELGATDTVDSAEADAVGAVRGLTADSGPMWSSMPWAVPRPTGRRSTPGIRPGAWCWSVCPIRRTGSSCRYSTSSAAAAP